MKSLFLLLSFASLAGCATFPERMRDRFSTVPPQTEVFDADARVAYFAAQQAFKRLDFNLTRSSHAGYEVEAASRINRSAVFRDSRQLIARVEVVSLGPERCEVSVWLKEQMEADQLGGPSELALREHGFFSTYFAVLQQVLAEQAGNESAAKP
jgi:hypothetical protein